MPFVIPVLAAIGGGSALAGGALVASTAAGVYGASQQSKAVKSAAQAQTDASSAAIAEQQRQFDINQSNLKPYLTAGQSALQSQMALLGLGGTPATPAAAAPAASAQPDYAAYVQNNPDLLAAYQSQTGLARGKSIDQFGAEHWAGPGQGENRPYTPFGDPSAQTATAAPTPGTPGVDAATAQQSAIDGLKNSPLYQSLYQNGQNTLLANASATGGLRGGNVQRSLANFGSDTLSSVIENQLSHLSGISGQGASTGATLGQLGAGTSGNISSLLVGQGQAQAGGILGSANANASGLSALLSGLGQGVGGLRASGYLGGGINTNQPALV